MKSTSTTNKVMGIESSSSQEKSSVGLKPKLTFEAWIATRKDLDGMCPIIGFCDLEDAWKARDAEVAELEAVLLKAREALEFYADPKKWFKFDVMGKIGSARDGEPAMMFDDGEDHPWTTAARALETVHTSSDSLNPKESVKQNKGEL